MKKKQHSRALLLSLTSIAASTSPTLASAQQTEPAAPVEAPASEATETSAQATATPPPPSGDGAMIEEVIVSAQKRDQALQDVPISITALSSDTLEKANFSSVNELPAMVPGLRIDASGAFFQPTIRGVGSSIAGVGFTSNIATYVDGFYIPSQATTNMQLINLKSVQVLKGPQGTLFGRNATGGAILLSMADPSHVTSGTFKASYGSYNRTNFSTYGTTEVSDSVAVDVSGYWETSDGYVDNIVTGRDDDGALSRRGVRLSSIWDAADGLSFKLAIQHDDIDDATVNATSAYKGESTGTGMDGAVVADRPRDVSNDGRTEFSSQVDGVYLTTKADLGFAELVSYTMGRKEQNQQLLDLDSSSLPIFHTYFNIENEAYSQEFNLSGDLLDKKLEWIAGLYYLNVDEHFTDLGVAAFGNPFTSLYDVRSKMESYALFLDGTYHFDEQWSLTLGGRYSDEDATGYINIHPGGLAFGLSPVEPFSDSWSSFTPRVVLGYKPTDRSNIYASVSRGFKAGQVSPSSLSQVTVDPEKITAYEIGYKLAQSRIMFDVAAFYYDYKDMQVAGFDGISALVTNAATSTIYGGEMQIFGALTEQWTAKLGLSYVHGEYDSYPSAPYYERADDGTYPATSRDASGNMMQRAPKLTGNLGLQYETPVAKGRMRYNADGYYTSKFYFDPANNYPQKAYALLNVSVSWIDPSDRWTLSLYGKNVTDETYRSQVLAGQFAIQQSYGEPATVGFSTTYKF